MDTRGRRARLRYRILKALGGGVAASRAMGVKVGDGCRLLSKVVTSEPWLVEIGDRVTISTSVQIVTHDGSGWLVRDARGRRYRYAPVKIGSDVFVGVRSVIMPGVEIGDRCIVAAGSVVTRSVPSGSVVAGTPARVIGSYDDVEQKMLAWPAETDRRGTTYREQVDSIVERSFRPALDAN